MKRRKPIHDSSVRPRGEKYLSAFPNVLLALSLGLGSVVSGGCVAIPAVMVTSAAVTAVAVVSEGERLVRYPDTENSAIVRNETVGDSFRGEAPQRHEPETLRDPDRPRT